LPNLKKIEAEKARGVVQIVNFEPKNLFTIFFRASDVGHISYLDKDKTTNHQPNFKETKVYVCYQEFHHENAETHIHMSVKKYLKGNHQYKRNFKLKALLIGFCSF